MPRSSERSIIAVLGAVQFINILDFVMVMPLGPDLSRSLGIPSAHLGYIGGAYTAAAAVAGLAAATFLDRFDRRSALTVATLGLVIGTAAGGLATGMGSLIAARLVAGAFGGPATSLAFSIVADVVPIERRGRATGALMGAFAAASVLGVPIGLELARRLGWQAPFFAVAGLGVIVTLGARYLLPSMTGHLTARRGPRPPLRALFGQPLVIGSYLMTMVAMAGGFLLIPNISAYVQFNLRFPRAQLGLIYLVGGLVSFFATRLAGALNDRIGAFRTGALGSAFLVVATFIGFVMVPPPLPVLGIFVVFFLAMAFRNVSFQTLSTKVPRPHERAGFMSIQSSVAHMAAALGAGGASLFLTELPGGNLAGMAKVAWLSIGFAAALPALLWWVERRVQARVTPVAQVD